MNRTWGLVLAALAVIAVAGVGLFLYFRGGLPGAGRELVVLGFGGEFPDAQRPAYFRPFTSETEVRVRETTYDGDYEQLEARLKGESAPDVVQVDAAALLRGVRDGLFLPIDYDIVPKGDLLPQAAHEFGVGTDAYSVTLGWNRKKLPEGTAPKSWADFWDVKKYPGGRSLPKGPRFTLEIALMADGVSRAEVYQDGKLDVDRAFRKLDQIKPHVRAWWTDAGEPVRQLASGEVVMAAARGERLSAAAQQPDAAVLLTWNQGVVGIDYWAVPRAARNPEQAMRFIAYANKSDRQATFATLLPLGPINPKAVGHIEQGFARRLNTHPANLPQQVYLDARWWDEHGEEVSRRFERWLGE
jgi:putative spermidine/putrescine transport system substrate-binding protein